MIGKNKINKAAFDDLNRRFNWLRKQYREYQEPVNPVKTYKALLSQTATYTSSGVLIAGKTYVITSLTLGDDFANVGYVAEYVDFIATGTTPTVWTNNTKVYEQVTNTPTAIEIENTFDSGEISFSFQGFKPRLDFGQAFPTNKLFVLSEYGAIANRQTTYIQVGQNKTNLSILIELYP